MELIDRYLQAVKFALPKSQRDDIVKELADSLLSQVEEREAALGRPLTEDEQAELLRKVGSPTKLAASYREQQGLIGATVLPIYWKVLQAGLGVSFLVQVIAAITMAAAGRPLLVSLAPIFHYPAVALTVFAWVTLGFAALHFFGAKIQLGSNWDPRKLPPVMKPGRRKSRIESIAALIIGAIATVWWLVGLHNPWLIMGPGVMFMTFAPIWLKLFPVFVVMAVADVFRHSLEVVRPYATRQHAIGTLVMRGLSLVVLAFLIRAGELFVAADPGNSQMQQAVASVNYALHLGLLIAAAIAFVKLLFDTWKLLWGRVDEAHQPALG